MGHSSEDRLSEGVEGVGKAARDDRGSVPEYGKKPGRVAPAGVRDLRAVGPTGDACLDRAIKI